ncbi:methyl-accepting chemotaxis protein [Methylomonas koyamae]|uniref:HAMP domain-containing methyl-accepting chemotaxis protein n=1 Tax=Methylomonas koyamae TaxID=702114 RepID=UPI00112C64FE|nr:methyl-accepting chemotaxis protein [Methylomonas koyamae]TPQ27209.1 hypothetical protein C2U68_09050 [Methylomonas koyamae]
MQLTIRNKLIASFSALVLILVIFGLLAWIYIGRLGSSLDEIAEWKVPAVKLAVDVHAGAYDATIEQLNYLLYEREETYSRAKQVLNTMDDNLNKVDKIGNTFSDKALLEQSASVRNNVKDFRELYDNGVAALKNNRQAVDTMVNSGRAVLAEADAFAEKQETEYAKLLENGASQTELNGKVQKYILVNRIKSLAQTIIQHEKEERLYKDRQYYQQMQQELPALMVLYDKLAAITPEPTEHERIDKARAETAKYQNAAAQWIDNDTRLKQIVAKMDQIAASARQSAAAAEQDGWSKAQEIAGKTVALVGQANTIIVVCLILGIVIGVGMAFTVPTNIVNSINALSKFAKAFGTGNLTVRTRFSPSDEIGVMAQDFDHAAESIHKIVGKVSGYSQTLQRNAEVLLRAVENNSAGAQSQKEYIEQVASAMTEMAAAVQAVARNASQAAGAAAETDRQARAGQTVVQQAVGSINALAREIADAAGTVSNLENHVNDISSILDVIRSVSEQTNLLALNAAIEAARAGEHGRGFAVVADEVRTLASRTQSSTSEIQSMIEKLQSGSKQAVVAMNASRTLAEQSVEKAQASGQALGAITQSVATISTMNTQIATSAEQQNAVTEEVSYTVIKITEIAETGVDTARASLKSGIELTDLAKELEQAVSQFKV